jgi:hypothetical protein
MAKATRVHSTPRKTAFKMNPPVDPTRRHLLTVAAGGAVAAAIPTVALAAAPAVDPVFDLIEIHRKAHAAHYAAIHELGRLEEAGDRNSGWITEQPCHDENDAFDELVAAAATTLPGLFDYLLEFAEREAWMFGERTGAATALIESFAVSLKNIGVQA